MAEVEGIGKEYLCEDERVGETCWAALSADASLKNKNGMRGNTIV